MKIRVLVKNIVKKFMLLDLYCKDCGNKIEEVWITDDSLYERVVGNLEKELCIKCFSKRAKKKGIYLTWKPVVS